MSTTFTRGQKVSIRDTESRHDVAYIGRTGTYQGREAFGPRFVFRVRVDSGNPFTEDTKIVRATHIQAAESPQEFKRGDRVIVREMFPGQTAHSYVGKAGVYQGRTPIGKHLVKLDFAGGPIVRAARVEAAPSEAVSDVSALIDPARATAAALAHQILGKDPLLEDLVGLAEFLLGAKAVRVVAPQPEPAPTVKPEEPMSLEEAREVVKSDLEFGSLDIGLDKNPDDDVVRVFHDGSTYLKADDVDTLIRFLQAAKIVHAAR